MSILVGISVAFALAAIALCVKVERGTRGAKKELETLIKNKNNE